MVTAVSSRQALASLEFHRQGVGQVRVSASGQRGSAAFVSRGPAEAMAVKTCSCSTGRAKKRTCAHLAELQSLVDECHASWSGRSWDVVFRQTLWYRLAEHLFEGDRQPCSRVRLSIRRSGVALHGGDGIPLLWSVTMTPGTERLLDRCGAAPGVDPSASRARLLGHLQLLQLSPHERALHDAGMPTNRQAFESSFWWRLAYHCVREYDGGTFHPAVDEETAAFVLTFRPPDDAPMQLALPRAGVESVMRELAAAFPAQADLQVQPIPLMSIFKIGASTELDLDVRPQVRLLQEDGHARYLEREEVERFRYGRLVYVRELGVLAELERPDRERRFAAPIRMQLKASQVPRLLEDLALAGEAAPMLVDTSEREIRILTEPDAIEVAPHEKVGGAYWASVRYKFDAASISLADVLRARRDKLPFLPTPGGWVDVHSSSFAPLARLGAAADPTAVNGDRVRLSPRDLLRIRGGSEAPLRVSAGEAAAALVQRLLDFRAAEPVLDPPGLTSPLHPYQRLGLDWLVFLYENELSGLLCDEMGLGKTHQALSLLLTVAARGASDPFLVVCPTSVVSHWRDKLTTYAPNLPLAIYYGPEREISRDRDGARVFLTSYGVLRNDARHLATMRFSVAIFDEIQQLKNSGTLGYKAAEQIDARMRLGLTGTPIENDVGELKSLVDLLLPGYLGTDGEFAERFGATSAREAQPRHVALRRVLAPFLLRRVKAAVLDELPGKTEDLRMCPLSPEQARLYREALEAKAGPLVKALRQDGQPVPYLHVFALLNRLKQICAHPALALKRPGDYARHASGKWEAFEEILDQSLSSGQKVIVFTQFLGMVDILERSLRDRRIGFATLTGSTRDRGDVIRRFDTDDDCRVFVASLKAAGQGIDLVAGSVVVHYDRWWNAAREDQATDRAHRIGQKRAVQVFKLVAEGTLEERIAKMIDDKRRLMESVVRADDPTLAKTFTREELLALLQAVPSS
jgi:superfamily II DNA or RNA helicase